MEVPVQNAEIWADLDKDIAKIAVIDRHHATGRLQVGLVHGFGFNLPCAVASTVAHDCHQMVIVGTDDHNMAIAANQLAEIGGGQIVVKEGKVIGQVALPIAGLMSNQRAEIVARQAASVLEGFRQCGCKLNNPNMPLSFLALVVIPDLRISDLGIVDVTQFKIIPLLESTSP
jgi:adenine deaminase